MKQAMQNAAMLWTGGKDSSLALHEAKLMGYRICCLVTFVPPEADFLAHPLLFMKNQALAMDLPHEQWEVNQPFDKSYEEGIRWLKKTRGIDTLITGDIAEVARNPNWIRERGRVTGVDVQTPLWGRERCRLMDSLLTHGFKVLFSCVKKPWFTKKWVGTLLDRATLRKLRDLSTRTGMDLCGEEGEYHTLVVDGPMFKKRIHIGSCSRQSKKDLMYLNIRKMTLEKRNGFSSSRSEKEKYE